MATNRRNSRKNEIYAVDKENDRFAKLLPIFRRLCDWSTDEMGYRVDLTKQTICNLERTNKINCQQYFLFRETFENEVLKGENPRLAKAYEIFMCDESLEDEKFETLLGQWENATRAIVDIKLMQVFRDVSRKNVKTPSKDQVMVIRDLAFKTYLCEEDDYLNNIDYKKIRKYAWRQKYLNMIFEKNSNLRKSKYD